MAPITDEELTKLAIQEILKDAKRFKEKRDAEFRATQMKRPMQTNKPFLKNTLRDVLSFNKSRNRECNKTNQSSNRSTNNDKCTKRKLVNKGHSYKFVKNIASNRDKTVHNKEKLRIVNNVHECSENKIKKK